MSISEFMKNNPYIEKVTQHPYIFTTREEIYSHKGKWGEYFGDDHPLVLEIGTGQGNFFSGEVHTHSERNYVGMELRYKRLYNTAEKSLGNRSNYAQSAGGTGTNFVMLKEYGEKVEEIFGSEELSITYVFFPDPWARKDKQKKKRLLQTQFLQDVYRVTKTGGRLYIKTDHREYFEFVLEELKPTDWRIVVQSFDYVSDNLSDNAETTEFEQIFRGQKIEFCYLALEK